jgi:membrane protease YdiL (CAAX protease family)
MAVVGWVFAILLGGVGVGIATVAGLGELGMLLLSQAGLWTGMLATCWFVSHRYGSGDVGQDYRLVVWRKDLGWGVLLSIVARVATIVVLVPLYLLDDRLVEGPRQLPTLDHNTANVAAIIVIAVIGAPIIEELFFRGLVQRALETVLPVAAAIGIQALLFGAIHAMPGAGDANVGLVVAITASGAVFGFAAWKWRRLGPGIVAHAFFNLLPTIGLVLG